MSETMLGELRFVVNHQMDSCSLFPLIMVGQLSQKSDNCPYPSNYTILDNGQSIEKPIVSMKIPRIISDI